MPVFGKGDPIVVDDDSDDEYMAKKKKKKEGEGSTPDKDGKVRPKSEPKEKAAEPSFQFGWINVLLIFGIGAIFCVKLGLFEGDNVPDFVAKRDDLQYYFKSLAAPEEPPPQGNATHHADGRKKKASEQDPDPFAAPKSEKVSY